MSRARCELHNREREALERAQSGSVGKGLASTVEAPAEVPAGVRGMQQTPHLQMSSLVIVS